MSKFGKVFRELLDGAVPRDDALFLVLRNGNPYSIQLSDTYQKLFKDLKDEYKISSMAYHDSGEYSRTAHDHDCYTKTVNHFIQPGGFPVGDGCTKIMDVYTSKMYEASMDSMYIPSYADRYDELLTQAYKKNAMFIGKMKMFFGQIDNANVDITNENFDGWVFPRGQSYEIGNFVLSSELENAFGSTNGIFTVPCLSNFVKIATDGIYENHEFLTKHPGRNSVPEHRHTMTNASNSEIDISVEEDKIDPNIIWNTLHSNGCSNSHGTIPHHGKKSKKQDIYNTGFEMDLPDTFKIHADNIQSGKYGSSYSEANEATTETYPTYTNLPVMIYIGPSIYSIGK